MSGFLSFLQIITQVFKVHSTESGLRCLNYKDILQEKQHSLTTCEQQTPQLSIGINVCPRPNFPRLSNSRGLWNFVCKLLDSRTNILNWANVFTKGAGKCVKLPKITSHAEFVINIMMMGNVNALILLQRLFG